MKKLMISMSAAIAAMLSAQAEETFVTFENDFTTRTSSRPIPELGVWHEANPYPFTKTTQLHTYVTGTDDTGGKPTHGTLAKWGLQQLGYYGFTDFAAFYTEPSYDGWMAPNFLKGSATSVDGLYRQRSGVFFDSGNPCQMFWYNTTGAR